MELRSRSLPIPMDGRRPWSSRPGTPNSVESETALFTIRPPRPANREMLGQDALNNGRGNRLSSRSPSPNGVPFPPPAPWHESNMRSPHDQDRNFRQGPPRYRDDSPVGHQRDLPNRTHTFSPPRPYHHGEDVELGLGAGYSPQHRGIPDHSRLPPRRRSPHYPSRPNSPPPYASRDDQPQHRGIPDHSRLPPRRRSPHYPSRPNSPPPYASRDDQYRHDYRPPFHAGHRDYQRRPPNTARPIQPVFDGETSAWESFALQMRLLSRSYRWNDDDFHTHLVLAMRGKALTYVTSLPYRTQDDTDQLLRALEKRFGRHKLAETQRATLTSLRKTQKESWQEYCARVDELMSEAYPGMQGTEIYSSMAIEHFLRGIQDRKLAYEVQLRKPRDLSECVEMVMWHEACKQSAFRGAEVRYVDEGRSTDQESDSEAADMRRINRGRSKDRRSSDMRRVDNPPSLEEQLRKLLDEMDVRPPKRDARPGPRQLICYNCNKPGHISPECPDKPPHKRRFSRENSLNRNPQNSGNETGLC